MKRIALAIGVAALTGITWGVFGCDAGAGAGEGEGEGQGGEGEGQGPALEFCQDGCAVDGDCAAAEHCNSDLVCAPDACTTNEACTAGASGWDTTACAANNPCALGKCVDIDGAGTGGCALSAADEGGACLFGAEIPAHDIINNVTVQVCGVAQTCGASGACEGGADPLACANDGDCANFATAGLGHCVGGSCGCNADADCSGAANARGPKCASNHFCGCGANTDCAGDTNGDTCDTATGDCTCTSSAGCSDATKDTCAAPATPG